MIILKILTITLYLITSAYSFIVLQGPNLTNKKPYLAYSIGMTGSGKTTLFNNLNKLEKTCVNLIFHSTDKIRSQLAQQMVDENIVSDYNEAVKKFNNEAALLQKVYDVFDSELLEMLHKFNNEKNQKINIIYIDRNMYYSSKNSFFNKFPAELYEKIVFIPKSDKRLSYLPFSLDYIVQCFNRVKNRNHPTLTEKVDKLYYLTVFTVIKKNKGTFSLNDFKNEIVVEVTSSDESKPLDASDDSVKANRFLEELINSSISNFSLLEDIGDADKAKIHFLVYYFLSRYNEVKFKDTHVELKRDIKNFVVKYSICKNGLRLEK